MNFLAAVFIGALVLRLIGWYFFNYVLYEGEFFHFDSIYYHETAVDQAANWRNGDFDIRRYPAYSNLFAPLYALFGAFRIIPEMMSVLAGALVVIPLYFIGRQMGGIGTARWASTLGMIDPLLIYYSTQLLRDSLIALAFAMAVWGIIARNARYGLLTLLGAGAISIVFNRFYLSFTLAASLIGVSLLYLVAVRKWPVRWGVLGIGCLVATYAGYLLIFTGEALESGGMLDTLNAYGGRLKDVAFTNEFFNELNQGFGPFANYWEAALYLPEAAVKGLLLPYPWIADTPIEMVAAGYMIWWYALLILGFAQVSIILQKNPRNWNTLILFGIVITLAIGLGSVMLIMSGLFRWRMPILLIMIIWTSGVLNMGYEQRRRVLDIAVASASLIALLPVIVGIMTVLRLTQKSVFFSQPRRGKGGKIFTIYKFCTMTPGSDGVALGDTDPRLTKIGRILRKTALDEIPECWNIIKGDMAVVGPRPLALWEDDRCRANIPGWDARYQVMQGLCGLAQIRTDRRRNDHKLGVDLDYIKERSTLLDMKIFALNASNNLRGKWH